ncbi:hypothetical protein M3654_24340, partial [Bacillus licheniformis]|nr:hypothetical protein [Bacillus licheniformis]
ANIRETDAITHVVRCFEDENVIHFAGKVSPIDDIEVINTELALADLGTIEKALTRYSKAAKSGNDKEAAKLVAVLEKVRAQLDATAFDLNFKDDRTMSFVGTAGQFKGVTDTVQYTAREVRPQVYMVYWHEPSTGSNV